MLAEALYRLNITFSCFISHTPDISQCAPLPDMCETKLGDVVAYFEVDLEGRFSKVRSEETNLGNFCADVILGKVSVNLRMLFALAHSSLEII